MSRWQEAVAGGAAVSMPFGVVAVGTNFSCERAQGRRPDVKKREALCFAVSYGGGVVPLSIALVYIK